MTVLAQRTIAAAPPGESFPRPEYVAPQRFRFLLILRPEDCTSHARFVSVLQRPELDAGIAPEGLLLGSRSELPRARKALAAAGVDLPLTPLTRRQTAALGRLGHTSMPFWILLDGEDRLVVTLPAPRTPDEFLRATRVLRVMIDDDPET